jgi:deoxyribonuclease V
MMARLGCDITAVVAAWPIDADALDVEQRRLAAMRPIPWTPPPGVLRVAACYLAFTRGQQGPGHAGDRGWAGAVLMELPGTRVLDRVAFPVAAGASYDPGRLARRAGPALEAAITRLSSRPDVVLVDATGRDHPRGAGLALHLGAVLDLPTVGVTHRPLIARGAWPSDEFGASTQLLVNTTAVGAWLRTRAHARPLAIHAAWRTDPPTAVEIVLRSVTRARTPEPLRAARELARATRAASVTIAFVPENGSPRRESG